MGIVLSFEMLKLLINEYGNVNISDIIQLEKRKKLLNATRQNKHLKAFN